MTSSNFAYLCLTPQYLSYISWVGFIVEEKCRNHQLDTSPPLSLHKVVWQLKSQF